MPWETLPYITNPETLAAHAALLERAGRFKAREWCQNALALDAAGAETEADNPAAAQRCALGHLHKTLLETNQMCWEPRLRRDLELAGTHQQPLATWNDQPGRKAAAVQRLFQQAAARLRERAATAQAEQNQKTG